MVRAYEFWVVLEWHSLRKGEENITISRFHSIPLLHLVDNPINIGVNPLHLWVHLSNENLSSLNPMGLLILHVLDSRNPTLIAHEKNSESTCHRQDGEKIPKVKSCNIHPPAYLIFTHSLCHK